MTTRPVLALVFGLALSPTPSAQPPTIMKLKDGRVMHLKSPPRIAGGRIVFTTLDGRTYSLDESTVVAIGAEPTPTPTPRVLNPLDSHNLGAIARQQRQQTGKRSEVAARATPTPRPRHWLKRTPTPRPNINRAG